MRRIVGLVLVGVGACLIGLAIALPTYVYPRVAKVPADPNRTLTYTGKDVSVFLIRGTDDGGPRAVDGVTLTATRYVSSDVRPSASRPGPDDVLWQQTFRADAEGYGLLTAYVEGISFDNRTGEATNCCGDYVRYDQADPKGQSIKHQGLLLKFPFATQKRSYDFWDLQLKRATPAVFDGTEKIDGLETYRFIQDIPAETTQQQQVPASVFGLTTPGNVDADDVYQNRRTIWVEPETGSIIKGTETQKRRLVAEGREVPALVGTIANTDKNVQDAVDEYGPLGKQLHLVRVTGPLVSWIAGPVLLLLGVLLLAMRRREPGEPEDEDSTFEPVIPGRPSRGREASVPADQSTQGAEATAPAERPERVPPRSGAATRPPAAGTRPEPPRRTPREAPTEALPQDRLRARPETTGDAGPVRPAAAEPAEASPTPRKVVPRNGARPARAPASRPNRPVRRPPADS